MQSAGDINLTQGCFSIGGSSIGSGVGGSCISDRRLKKNIESIRGALDKVCRLRPVHYRWRTDEIPLLARREKGLQTGLIAQEVEEVFPDLVKNGTDGYKRINYDTDFEVYLIQAVKELRAEKDGQIAELKSKHEEELRALRAENAEIKALVCLDHPTADLCAKKHASLEENAHVETR